MFELNFLKNLFNFYTEKKPEKTMSKYGVFIRNGQNDGEIIDGCIKFHQDIKSDAKIVAVKKNEACKGMEVFFNSGSGVLALLKKKHLTGNNGISTIHSLTTALSLQEAFPIEEEEFKNAVRNQIQNLGTVQVLDILKVPYNWEYPDIGSGKWIIVLDIPEVDDLDVFKAMGLPDKMIMEFPSNGDRYVVKFHCRLCKKDGHVQFRCLDGASDESPSSTANQSSLDTSNNTRPTVSNAKPPRSMNTTRNQEVKLPIAESSVHPQNPNDVPCGTEFNSSKYSVASSKPSSGPMNLVNKEKNKILPKPTPRKIPSEFRIRDISEETPKPVPKANKPALPQKAIEAFEREIGTEEAQRYCTERNIKQEIEKQTTSFSLLKSSSTHSATENPDLPPSKRHCPSYEDDPKFYEKPNFYMESSNRASSTTEKDPEVIFESVSPFHRECSQNPPDNSPVVTTTHYQTEAVVKPEPPTTDEEDSNPAPKRRKKASPMLQVVIPENIRAIIDSVPEKVLDVRQLEAFFNHVKKKSRPADFARMYTENVKGLYEQLSEISRRYYLRPIVGSNEDLKFVKMLGNVLQRFHNGPAKRRSDAKK